MPRWETGRVFVKVILQAGQGNKMWTEADQCL